MSYADTVNWTGVPATAVPGIVIWNPAVVAGVTLKLPVPVSDVVTVSVAVMVCVPKVPRVTLV